MATPWKTLHRQSTPDGELELRQRSDDEFLITIAGRILMNSRANRSELVLAQRMCERLSGIDGPRILLCGLGMGCTLRAALDGLPETARIRVSELNSAIERWCAGPLAGVNGKALEDPRVRVAIEDVSQEIARHADDGDRPRLNAIVLDLFEGPHANTNPKRDPFYGSRALDATRRALAVGGIFAIWSEAPDASFEKRVKSIGFALERVRAGKGGRMHAVYIAMRKR
jgi:spermidine synthase